MELSSQKILKYSKWDSQNLKIFAISQKLYTNWFYFNDLALKAEDIYFSPNLHLYPCL